MDGEGGGPDSEENYDQESVRSNDEELEENYGQDQQEGGELVDTGIYTEVRYESG